MSGKTVNQHKRMTETPIPRLIAELSIPTIASMLVTSVYNMADTYFVSHLGESATGAVGIVFSVMAIIQAVGFTLGMGSGAQISRLLGQKDQEKAEIVAVSSFVAALLFGLLITVVGLAFVDPLMLLLGATNTILPYARDYAGYIFFGAPIMAASFVLNNILRAEGHATFSMIGITAGGILNIVLDPIFIFVLGLGTAGAAIATLLSQCISFAILFGFFLAGKSVVKLNVRKVSRRGIIYLDTVRTGMPSLCRQGLATVATVALNTAAKPYGDSAIAAMSVVGRVFMLLMSVLIGFGQGYMPVIGYNYGAQRYDRMRESLVFTLKTGIGAMAVLASCCAFAAPNIMGLFGNDPDMLKIGTFAIRAQCVGLLIQPIGTFSNMTFQSVRQAGKATFLSACRQGIYFLPLILILPGKLGLLGVEIAQPLADIMTSLTALPMIILFYRALRREEQQHQENSAT